MYNIDMTCICSTSILIVYRVTVYYWTINLNACRVVVVNGKSVPANAHIKQSEARLDRSFRTTILHRMRNDMYYICSHASGLINPARVRATRDPLNSINYGIYHFFLRTIAFNLRFFWNSLFYLILFWLCISIEFKYNHK